MRDNFLLISSIKASYLGSFTDINVEAEKSDKEHYIKAYAVKES
jgi:hypothetical protein